jgi:hypothetical protein
VSITLNEGSKMKGQIITFVCLALAVGLTIYAAGLVTHVWGNPVFSAFFFLKDNLEVPVYAFYAVIVAVAIAILGIFYPKKPAAT